MSMRNHCALEVDGTREQVIADIVEGGSLGTIGRRYNVSRQAVHQFRQRHREEIDAALALVRAALADCWVTVKRERIEALADDIAEIDARLAAESVGTDEFTALIRERRAHLRAVADELGDLGAPMVDLGRVSGYRAVQALQATIGDDPDLSDAAKVRLLATLTERL